MEHYDGDEGYWWTGVTYYQVYYRDSGIDDWNGYICEMTIPWIGIQMQGGSMVIYDHSQTTSAYHLYFDNSSYTYHSYTQQEQYTSLDVDYDLDFNGDSTIDWTFTERIEFNPPAQGNTGFFKIEFQVKTFPQNWVFGGVNVQTMVIPFLVDPDVYDSTQNQFYSGAIGNWNWEDDENSANGANNDIKIVNEFANPDEEIIIASNPQGVFPASRTFTLLERQADEYAHDPADYDDDISLENQNGLVWYLESYNVQVNPPPNQNGATWAGIVCDGFEA